MKTQPAAPKLTPTMRAVLTAIANGERVKPTCHRKTALVKLRDAKLIRRTWIDDNTPRDVITAKGRNALD